MRADKEFLPSGTIDWNSVAEASEAGRLLFVNWAACINDGVGLAMGDQFAAGAVKAMDAYAGTYGFVQRSRNEGLTCPAGRLRRPCQRGLCHLLRRGPHGPDAAVAVRPPVRRCAAGPGAGPATRP